ncbi:MAG: acyl-CoA dehydrogenase family protein [Saprospiraceae bacterium]
MRASEAAEILFDNCRIHKRQMLGEEAEGFIQAMKILDGGRISIASLSLGIAKGAYEASVKYAKGTPAVWTTHCRNFRASAQTGRYGYKVKPLNCSPARRAI